MHGFPFPWSNRQPAASYMSETIPPSRSRSLNDAMRSGCVKSQHHSWVLGATPSNDVAGRLQWEWTGRESNQSKRKAGESIYEGGDKLYVPVSQLQGLGRYSGASPEATPLHKLGSGQWEKAKRKAAEQVRNTAAELLNIYAQRAARKCYAFQLKPQDYEAFTGGFPFEETRDQQAAIDALMWAWVPNCCRISLFSRCRPRPRRSSSASSAFPVPFVIGPDVPFPLRSPLRARPGSDRTSAASGARLPRNRARAWPSGAKARWRPPRRCYQRPRLSRLP